MKRIFNSIWEFFSKPLSADLTRLPLSSFDEWVQQHKAGQYYAKWDGKEFVVMAPYGRAVAEFGNHQQAAIDSANTKNRLAANLRGIQQHNIVSPINEASQQRLQLIKGAQ